MSTHCADKGPAQEHKSTGSDHKVMGLDSYISEPSHPVKAAVVLITDVFGYNMPNARKFADNLAAQGFFTIIPDFFHGNPYVPPQDQSKFMEVLKIWLSAINYEHFYGEVHNIIEYLYKEKHVEKVGVVGFCWGGKQAFVTAQKLHNVNAAISVHGGWLTTEEVPKLIAPTLVLHTEIDTFYTAEQVAQLEVAMKAHPTHTFKVVPGQTHGFVMRGDFSNPVVAKAAQDVLDDCIAWFKTHLNNPIRSRY